MKKTVVVLLILALAVSIGVGFALNRSSLVSADAIQVSRPLERYEFNRLQGSTFFSNSFTLGKLVAGHGNYNTYLFSYDSWGRKITGVANIPKESQSASWRTKVKDQKFPVIIMIRGYVDTDAYSPGVGTERSAEYFADNGFITLAPDFLGYGGSDPAYADTLQTRFDAPVEVLNLIAAVDLLDKADPSRIGIWAHSNGGQIALSVLEISEKRYPTTLWAPVSKPFPESVLNYSSEMPDKGEFLQKIIGDFEKLYDPSLFSVTEFLKWVKGPLQLQQGLADKEVPVEWSDEFVARMASLGRDIPYFKYPGENHNFNNGSWQAAVSRDLVFFRKWLGS